jgi:hypothetical protein
LKRNSGKPQEKAFIIGSDSDLVSTLREADAYIREQLKR